MKRWQSQMFLNRENPGEWLDRREQEVFRMKLEATQMSEDNDDIHILVVISYYEEVGNDRDA